jgi:glycogen synthase
MKLLIYSNFFMPHPGGTQTIVLDLARGFSSRHATHPGSDAIRVTVATQTCEPWDQDASLPFTVVRGPSLGDLVRLIREADLVHLAGAALSPLVLCVLLRKPFVVEHHAFNVVCPNGQFFHEATQSLCPGHFMTGRYGQCLACCKVSMGARGAIAQIPLTGFRRWLCNRAAANIMPTDWLGTVLKLNRMKTVHHGIPPLAAEIPRAPSATVFGFQGRLVPTKGIDILLDACDRLAANSPNFTLKILGGGPSLDRLKARAATSSANVQFLGHVPDGQLPDMLAAISTVVMPSLAGEVFGLVAAENMLRGKLVVTSDLGSLKEVVGDAGLTFRNGDSTDLASVMSRTLNDPSSVASLGAKARSRAQSEFSLDAMVEKHVEIYESVLRR